jgi:hypothetical protein
MEYIQQLCSEYHKDDILNIDETSLFWKLTPNRTLTTQARSGGKKSKDRITLTFTVLASRKKEQV